jgi:hypothetical protein
MASPAVDVHERVLDPHAAVVHLLALAGVERGEEPLLGLAMLAARRLGLGLLGVGDEDEPRIATRQREPAVFGEVVAHAIEHDQCPEEEIVLAGLP